MKGDESLLDSASLVYKVAMSGALGSGGGRGEIRRTEREDVDDDVAIIQELGQSDGAARRRAARSIAHTRRS